MLKRKEPASSTPDRGQSKEHPSKRPKTQNARQIAVQTQDTALKNGELDVEKFVQAREWEIRALEAGMKNAKKALSTRAHQSVPRNLRRRTASHNVKRVPERLRERARKEMVEDNTPTVNSRTRKPRTAHARLRLETAKRLRTLATQSKVNKKAAKRARADSIKAGNAIFSRKPRPKTSEGVDGILSAPPKPVPKFRKRQIHKTWLPTHVFHSKRAHMTPPKEPLWWFAIPLTPTEKSYRPTHRASGLRGAIAWDTSYMSTISLEGAEESVSSLLRTMVIGAFDLEQRQLQGQAKKWMDGTRSWDGWAFERNGRPTKAIAPVMIIWCAPEAPAEERITGGVEKEDQDGIRLRSKSRRRKLFVRVHPSAFMQLWNELLAVAKMQYPPVMVEDLRFEIGSIEVIGPGSSEALQGVLKPIADGNGERQELNNAARTWVQLAGLTNPASLPSNVILGFSVSDPRLHHPPRSVTHPPPPDYETCLLNILAQWPPDSCPMSPALFQRNARLAAGRQLPSQKAINRRKALALAGTYPASLPTDPRIPVLLASSRPSQPGQGTWTLLLPWKCVLPIWYTLVHYPLSSGGSVRFGGLNERRQITFEAGMPWFPADYPGTDAGWAWEIMEKERRKREWASKPKGKRIEWDSINFGGGRKGEIGLGWACDWDRLVLGQQINSKETPKTKEAETSDKCPASSHNGVSRAENLSAGEPVSSTGRLIYHAHYSHSKGQLLQPISISSQAQPNQQSAAIITVKITLLTRGTPTPCARIYRLPTGSSDLRQKWLDLQPSASSKMQKHKSKPPIPMSDQNSPDAHRRRRWAALAQSLLLPPRPQIPDISGPMRAGDPNYPTVPGEEDLIGFITTGNFSLGEGRGVGIGCILAAKVTGPDAKLCIVREAGTTLGRLARWSYA